MLEGGEEAGVEVGSSGSEDRISFKSGLEDAGA